MRRIRATWASRFSSNRFASSRLVTPSAPDRLASIKRVEAFLEGCLIEMMHQAVEPLVPVPRRQPGYPCQFRGRDTWRLGGSHHVSLSRLAWPGALPSTGVTPLLRYYDPSDFLGAVSAPSLLRLSADTPVLGRAARICHVHRSALVACRALRPRGCRVHLPDLGARDVAFGTFNTLGHPTSTVYGAQSLQPCGLRPTTSLSTLNP